MKSSILEKISVLESREWVTKDYSWVLNGLNRLFRSRRILSYSYPFAFYMFGDEIFSDEMSKEEREIKRNLFEDQQQQLECNVEKLSKSLTVAFDQLSENQVLAARMDIINFSVLVDRLCHKMWALSLFLSLTIRVCLSLSHHCLLVHFSFPLKVTPHHLFLSSTLLYVHLRFSPSIWTIFISSEAVSSPYLSLTIPLFLSVPLYLHYGYGSLLCYIPILN